MKNEEYFNTERGLNTYQNYLHYDELGDDEEDVSKTPLVGSNFDFSRAKKHLKQEASVALTKDELIHKVLDAALLDPKSGQNRASVDGLLHYMKQAGVKDITRGDIITHAKKMTGLKVSGNMIMTDVKESVNEAVMTPSAMVKLFKNKADWGDMSDQVYVKGNNLVVVDTFFYGREDALNKLIKSWNPSGWYHNYFKNTYGVDTKVVDSFSEFKAEGRHKKITTDGIVGVVLKLTGGQDKPITENKMVNEAASLLKQSNLSSTEYQKAKKLKGFDAKNYKWDSNTQLYRNLKMESVNEATKRSVGKIVNNISKLTDEMKKQAAMYVTVRQKNDAKALAKQLDVLKKLTAEKKRLEAELDSAVMDLEKDVELVATDESVLRSLIRNKIKQNINENLLTEATRSQIGVIDKNGKILSTYVHWDGYPDGVGKTAKKYFNTSDKIKKLLTTDGGYGISSLAPKIDGGNDHTFQQPVKDQTVFYGRDRGEKTGNYIKGDLQSVDKFIKTAGNQSGAEYVYLFNTKDGKWYYADTSSNKELKLL